MRLSSWLISATLCVLFSCKPPEPALAPELYPQDGIINNQDQSFNQLKAVGQYDGTSLCTAVFVKLSDNLDAPAYVLTNGHCAQDWDASAVFLNTQSPGHSVRFNLFQNTTQTDQVTIPVKQIAYSTMKGTDLAIAELQATVRQLIDKGITPLPIAKAMPTAGTAIRIVGVPVNGIPQEEWVLRQISGTQGRKTDLIEFIWTWWDMYANHAPGIVGGYSGSPVLTTYKEGVFGLINTTTLGGSSPCYLGYPCELTNQGATPKEQTNYALSVLSVPGCFNASGQFDLTQPTCTLDKGQNVVLEGYPLGAYNPALPGRNGRPQQSLWNTSVSGYAYYRYKIGPVGTVNPREVGGYSGVMATATKPVILDSLPRAAGHYVLSVIGGNTATFDASWQQPGQATLARVEVDTQGPTLEPQIDRVDFGDSYRITLVFSPPELSSYYYKLGKPEETNAADPQGYRSYLRIPITVNKDELPLKLCVYGTDVAGNPTKIVEQLIQP